MKKIVLFLLFVPLFFSCGGGRNASPYVNTENTLVVSVPRPDYEKQHFFDVTRYADSVKYIQLETAPESLIAEISDVLFTDDYMIVVDRRSKSIFFFDYAGNYSHKIFRVGRGPGEYTSFGSVMLDPQTNWLRVYDVSSRTMITYDLQGNDIAIRSNFCNGMVIRDMIMLPNGEYLCYRHDELGDEPELQAGLWVANEAGDFDRFLYPFDFDYESSFVQFDYHLSQLPDGAISFVDQNQTDVFQVKDSVVYKTVQFDVPGKTEADFPGVKIMGQEHSYFSIFDSQEKGDYVFTEWIDDHHQGFRTILTKSTGEIESGMVFDFSAWGQFIFPGMFVRNNDPYISTSTFTPAQVEAYLQSGFPEEMQAQLKALIEGIPADQIENANPILQLLYIKK